MQYVLEQAELLCNQQVEIPVYAVICERSSGHIIVSSSNYMVRRHDATAHAELCAIQDACAITGKMRLNDYDLYVSLEPCPMCAAAIMHARIGRLYFSAYDIKMGGVEHGPKIFQSTSSFHQPEIYGGIFEERGKIIMQRFFQQKRNGYKKSPT